MTTAAATLLATLAWTAAAFAQAPPHFEVASIKPLPEGSRIQVIPTRSVARLTWPTNLAFLLAYAYNLPESRISGLPPSSDAYLIDATTPPKATYAELQPMFQALLSDRFHMTSHWITKEVDGFDLTVAKSGPKMLEAHEGDPTAPAPPMLRTYSAKALKRMDGLLIIDVPEPGVITMAGRKVTMEQLARQLVTNLQAPVTDRTNLTGLYYFDCEFARPNAPADANAGSLTEAMQHLGLKLEKRKTPVTVLVIDHIDRPTEN